MKPKPVKITGTATGTSNQKAVNFKNVQKISKVVTRDKGGINTPQVQPVYRETGTSAVRITGSARASQPSAAAVARFNKMNKYKMGNR